LESRDLPAVLEHLIIRGNVGDIHPFLAKNLKPIFQGVFDQPRATAGLDLKLVLQLGPRPGLGFRV
jgi:hypothetical protein